MKKLAIIGASYLQNPLIKKAKERGIETHVFAWASGDIGEREADFFYPISIVEKEEILSKCEEIGIDGICSIASDLAAITVNYVADKMNLIGNSLECTELSTNKYEMRKCFERKGAPSPRSILVQDASDIDISKMNFPVIVKPIDRSGSRGITKLESIDGLQNAIESAKNQGFQKCALVEEFVTGHEYSVEFISWEGNHHFITITQKYTTGSPNFIETGHLEPAQVSKEVQEEIVGIVTHALNSLGIQYGASHSELKITENGDIKLIEIGGRMGGDCIGSRLVELSTGFDFVGAVIDVALGIKPKVIKPKDRSAAIRFIFDRKDLDDYRKVLKEIPELLIEQDIHEISDEKVTDSSSRFGYFILSSDSIDKIVPYLPERTC